jgi:small subunit ribosomal protein S17
MKKRAHGIVKSDKMDKTITVVVERLRKYPKYEKYVRARSTCKAHDPHNTAKQGDLVEIEETRPLSKTKSWRLVRVLRRSAEIERVRLEPQEELIEQGEAPPESPPAPAGEEAQESKE